MGANNIDPVETTKADGPASLPPDKILDYGKELWTIGNVVAGFSIVQTLLFLEEAGKHCSALGVELAKHDGWYGLGGVGVFLGAELALVWLCHWGISVLLAAIQFQIISGECFGQQSGSGPAS